MTDDLVARLRRPPHSADGLCEKAADAITQLREQVAQLEREVSTTWQAGYDAKARAVTDADYSWKPRAQEHEATIATLQAERDSLRQAARAAPAQPVAWQLLGNDGHPTNWICLNPPVSGVGFTDEGDSWRPLYASHAGREETK